MWGCGVVVLHIIITFVTTITTKTMITMTAEKAEIDVKGAAELLSVDPETIRRYFRQKILPGFKKGLSRKIWFLKSDVEFFLKEKGQ